MLNDPSKELDLLHEVFDDLFPLLRSITGPGIEASIDYFQQYMPLVTTKVPSGSKVFDWTVPDEWHCKRARLWTPNGDLLCDSMVNNLHVLNYSEPVDAQMDLEELDSHLHSLPDLPEAVPYVTSYYSRTWGLCLKHNVRQHLPSGKYRVLIESEFKVGGVPFATCVLPGESSREILLASYLCHPSLANNELSGPLVLLALYRRIAAWERRRFSYRFVLNPETIGSLCFLSQFNEHLQEYLEAGLVITCIGGPATSLRYKASRRGNSLIDQLSRRISTGLEATPMPLRYEDFSPVSGSDERQYCSPGFNLPMGQFARSVYGDFPGYHNSLDDKQFMGIERLVESVDTIESLLKLTELGGKPVNLAPFGEPQLGKRGLYPNVNAASTWETSAAGVDGRTQLNRIMTILSMADGHTEMAKIADRCECTIRDLEGLVKRLEQEELLKFNTTSL
jgi:aminopeptidase-like protein